MAAVVLAGFLAGCASAPVQEMSDARQAIDAAEQAGAAAVAPAPLSEARFLLNSAEAKLARKAYNGARVDARQARQKAAEALAAARAEADQ
ncbi:MAG: DUF4398 domain-containing protein [Gammaproteobacteria bacterium]